MTAIVYLCVGFGFGVLARYLMERAAAERLPAASSSAGIPSTADTIGLQRLDDLRDLGVRIDRLQELQQTTAAKHEDGLVNLEWQLRKIASHFGALRSGGSSRELAAESSSGDAVAHGAAVPPASEPALGREVQDGLHEPSGIQVTSAAISARAEEPASPMASLVTRWNDLDWPHGASEVARLFARELHSEWRMSDELRHKYFLLYRALPGSTGQPMYLLPFLGKNMALFNDFFDGPAPGVAGRLIEAAEVEFREHNTTIEQELAKLMHSSYSAEEVLVVSKRGQIA